MKIDKLSTSRIKQYVRCPQQYYFDRHSDKKPMDIIDQTALHRGSIIHEVLEKLRYKPKKEIIPELINEVNENYDEYTLSYSEIQDITKSLERWLRTRDLGYEIIDVEKYFKIPVKDFHLTGQIDVVEKLDNGILRVTDYKTGKTQRDKKDMMNSTQLKLYTLASMEIYDVANVETSFDQINYPAPEYIQYSRDDLVEFLQYVISIKNKIENDEVQRPNPDWHCGFCDYINHCPVMQGEIEDLEMDNITYEEMADQYKKVKGKIRTLENKKEKLKKCMTSRMEEENKDKYESEEIRISKVQNSYKNYNPQTVIENVPPQKINKVLSVNKTKLDKLNLNQESRDKIEMDTHITCSNPYVRITHKEKD